MRKADKAEGGNVLVPFQIKHPRGYCLVNQCQAETLGKLNAFNAEQKHCLEQVGFVWHTHSWIKRPRPMTFFKGFSGLWLARDFRLFQRQSGQAGSSGVLESVSSYRF